MTTDRSSTSRGRVGVKLTGSQADRAAGVLLAAACGDALGAAYEFGPALADDAVVEMKGGGRFGWAPGSGPTTPRWPSPSLGPQPPAPTCATAWCSTGSSPRGQGWAIGARDVGVQTSAVLHGLCPPRRASLDMSHARLTHVAESVSIPWARWIRTRRHRRRDTIVLDTSSGRSPWPACLQGALAGVSDVRYRSISHADCRKGKSALLRVPRFTETGAVPLSGAKQAHSQTAG